MKETFFSHLLKRLKFTTRFVLFVEEKRIKKKSQLRERRTEKWRHRTETGGASRCRGLRTGGEGASRANPGVLVTHASTLPRSAVGLRGCVRRRQFSASAPRDGGAAAAARPVGAHAGAGCPGGGAFASCDDVRCCLALRCRASACAFGPTWEDQGDMDCTWRCTDDVPSSPHIKSPQPGDHSPCLHCVSM